MFLNSLPMPIPMPMPMILNLNFIFKNLNSIVTLNL